MSQSYDIVTQPTVMECGLRITLWPSEGSPADWNWTTLLDEGQAAVRACARQPAPPGHEVVWEVTVRAEIVSTAEPRHLWDWDWADLLDVMAAELASVKVVDAL